MTKINKFNNFTKFSAILISIVLISLMLVLPHLLKPVYAPSGSSNVVVINSQVYGQLNSADFPNFTFTNKAASNVTSLADLRSFDTAILYQFCDVGSFNNTQSAIISFLQNGGKVIILDSDYCSLDNTADYSWLSAIDGQFAVSTVGRTGEFGGTLTIKEENNLDCSDPTKSCFIDTTTITNSTDAVADLNVMIINKTSAAWCADMTGTNIRGASGFAEAYTVSGSLTGAPNALIIYIGLDQDYATQQPFLKKILELTLEHGWGAPGSAAVSDLKCPVPVNPNPIPAWVIVTTSTTAIVAVGGTIAALNIPKPIPQPKIPPHTTLTIRSNVMVEIIRR